MKYSQKQVSMAKIENNNQDTFKENKIATQLHQGPLFHIQNLNQQIEQSSLNYIYFDRRQQTPMHRQDKESMNHNFQKHAVITIKKLLKIPYNRNGNASEKLAHQIWNIFQTQPLKSKRMLVILFGKAQLQQNGYRNLLTKCGFEQLLTEQEGLIQNAQQIIREQFISTVTEETVQQNIRQCRNIKLKHQFIAYFMELVNLLREGPLLKMRLNDRTIKKIKTAIEGQQI